MAHLEWVFFRLEFGGCVRHKVPLGTKFLLNCGVEVEVVSAPRKAEIVVKDSDGRSRTCDYSQLKSGSLKWFGLRKPFGATRPSVGKKYGLNCGVIVEVAEYINAFRINVEDEFGNSKWVTSEDLRSGYVGWDEFGVPKRFASFPKVGDRYSTKLYGWFEVIEFVNAKTIYVKFDNTQRVVCAPAYLVRNGDVRDVNPSHRMRSLDKYELGEWYPTDKWGRFKILSVPNSKDIVVEWENTGHIQRGVKADRIYNGKLFDTLKASQDPTYDPKGHYVYFVMFNNDIVYIGKGFGTRYRHTQNGCSHVYELNKHHFAGDSLSLTIYKDDMTKEDSLALELEMIKLHKPKYNTMHNSEPDCKNDIISDNFQIPPENFGPLL